MDQELATKIIEALRSGIPTRDSTQYLTTPRDRLHAKFKDDLSQLMSNATIPKGRLIWGKYGQGKTHELAKLEHLALNMGFAVSRVTLNRQLSGQRLDHLYTKLANSVRTPNSNLQGIRHLLDSKSRDDLRETDILRESRYTHPLPVLVLETYLSANLEQQESLYSAFLGYSVSMTEIKSIYRSIANTSFPKFSDNFVRTKHARAYFEVMADVIKWCNCQGWVILIDEIELIARLSKVGRLSAYQNLYWLLNWSNTLQFPIYTVGAVAEPLLSFWLTSQRVGQPSELELIAALAAEKFGTDGEAERGMRHFFQCAQNQELCPFVEQLSPSEIEDLLTRIVKAHSICYDWQPSIKISEVTKSIGHAPVRTYIRALLETLDMEYLGDRHYIPMLTELQEVAIKEDSSFFTEEDANFH